MKKLMASFLLLGSSVVAYAQTAQPELWWWQSTEPNSPANVAALEADIDAAVGMGYTGIALFEGSITFMGSKYGSDQRTAYIQQVVNYAHAKGLKTIAPITPYGYSDLFLQSNPNYAEGERIIGSQFTVNAAGNQLVPINNFPGAVNPGFESGLSGWFGTKDPDIGIDTTVAHSGNASGVIANSVQYSRFSQSLSLTPWRQYHVRYWTKTQNFSSGNAAMEVFDQSSGASAYYTPLLVASTQDWTQYDFTFNSRDFTQPNIYFGVWGGSTGTIWFDDILIEETSLIYVLRRNGTPLTIYDPANPTTIFQEGRDVNPIADPNIANNAAGLAFTDQWHTPATVTLPAGTTLAPGQTVAMDYYAVAPIQANGDVGMCLTDAGPQSLMQANTTAVTSALGSATGYLLGYDELRHMNSCATCRAKNMTAGQLLGWHVGQTYNYLQSLAPGAQTYVWNDMFDPYHNAVDNYYRVEGTIAGSWTGLPPQITIMNWNLGNLTNSLSWFSGINPQQPTAFRQIIAGYYDSGDGTGSATNELQAAQGIPGIAGLMYTTWQGDYTQLQNFATAAKANWAAYQASLAANVSGQVTVTHSAFGRNHATGLWGGTMTVTNKGTSSVSGPVNVVLTGLPSGDTLQNNTGTFNGSPYVTVSTGALAAGASVTITIQFTNPSNGFITYTPVVYSGGI
jgi:hypothetical protein